MAFHFVFLSEEFYKDYINCPEIEQKKDRPYICLLIDIDGMQFAIPLRSHIHHPHAYLTDPQNQCGVDYSKAIVLKKPEYVDQIRKPFIRPNEFDTLRGKEHIIEMGMQKYLRAFRKALQSPDVPRNALLLRFSALQYFVEEIQHNQA